MGNMRSSETLCKLSFWTSVFALSFICLNSKLQANDSPCSAHCKSEDLKLGISLETRFWNLVQKHDVDAYSAKISSIFQGLSLSGVYTRCQQISGLSKASLKCFKIRNPKANRSGNVLVFSYDFIAKGKGITSGPSITVWKKENCSWKIVSHSYVPFSKDL